MKTISFVFVNGEFNKDLSDISLLPDTTNFQCEDNQILLHVPKHQAIPYPLHFKYFNGREKLNTKIIVDENSQLALIEEYASDHERSYLTNATLELQLHKSANMRYYKIQNENQNALHQGYVQVEQKEASDLKMFFADCGSNKARSDVKIHLSERHASCSMHGLYFLNHDEQQVDNAIHVEHVAESGMSSMIFKGVLNKKSKAFFQGKVHVHEHAKRTNAHQENHNLLLSASAEVSSQPKLEIYADDIRCTHGATVGQLDQDSLFYLRSRGIEETVALKMLTDAFVAEIMEKIDDASIRSYIQTRVAQHEAF